MQIRQRLQCDKIKNNEIISPFITLIAQLILKGTGITKMMHLIKSLRYSVKKGGYFAVWFVTGDQRWCNRYGWKHDR